MAASGAYRPRICDAELAHRLQVAGAVLIEGPRACGKTATARQAAANEVLLDVDENAHPCEIPPSAIFAFFPDP